MMDIPEKIQTFLRVVEGSAHPSALKPLLPAEGEAEENWIRLGVEHLIGKVMQRNGSAKHRFRFKIVENGSEAFTSWHAEGSQFDASMAMSEVRKAHPRAEISIERQY